VQEGLGKSGKLGIEKSLEKTRNKGKEVLLPRKGLGEGKRPSWASDSKNAKKKIQKKEKNVQIFSTLRPGGEVGKVQTRTKNVL